jgi:two-component system, chemotaxis family, chemotaxis protein CheY
MKFLVVDDSPTMRRIVNNTLKGLGYSDIVEAEDGKEALAKLFAGPVDFIITDWNMPNMNGLEFVQAVREDDKLSSIPILMVTTRGNKQDILDAMQAKVNSYVIKPFTPPVIKEKIEMIMASL